LTAQFLVGALHRPLIGVLVNHILTEFLLTRLYCILEMLFPFPFHVSLSPYSDLALVIMDQVFLPPGG